MKPALYFVFWLLLSTTDQNYADDTTRKPLTPMKQLTEMPLAHQLEKTPAQIAEDPLAGAKLAFFVGLEGNGAFPDLTLKIENEGGEMPAISLSEENVFFTFTDPAGQPIAIPMYVFECGPDPKLRKEQATEPLLTVHDRNGRAIETDPQGRVSIAVGPKTSRIVVIKLGRLIQEAVLAGLDNSKEKESQGTIRVLVRVSSAAKPEEGRMFMSERISLPIDLRKKGK